MHRPCWLHVPRWTCCGRLLWRRPWRARQRPAAVAAAVAVAAIASSGQSGRTLAMATAASLRIWWM
eukprot:351621-Chlamydomonas_euryale.AAC.4